ncbi:MAG: cyclic nucleotide-binding domain-containing protein [Deltaproteobacteria bacterium]|nr:cyclic nucleotide-binding domain-containing protein [Deltaproteobacteria bacterium]
MTKEAPIFRHLSPAEREELWTRTSSLKVAAGQKIFADGDPGDALYIVQRGRVSIRKKDGGGAEREIATLGDGEIFGEMSLLAEEPRSASAYAVDAVELRRLSRQEFTRLLDGDDLICYKMYRTLAYTLHARLTAVNAKVMELVKRPEVREEFATFKEKLLSVWSV